jgi:hypothetical protein
VYILLLLVLIDPFRSDPSASQRHPTIPYAVCIFLFLS